MLKKNGKSKAGVRSTSAGVGSKISHRSSKTRQSTDVTIKIASVEQKNFDKDQWSLLHKATYDGNLEMVKMLINYDVDINAKAADDKTSLHVACIKGYLNIAKLLIQRGAEYDVPDSDGNTPTHLCSEYGHHDLLKFILSKRPTLYCLNHQGKSPVDVAADSEILQIFDEHLNIIKNELFNNIAEMNGININTQLKHQHKLSHDVNLDDNLNYKNNSQFDNIAFTQRNKKGQVSDYSQNSENLSTNAELTIREIKHKFRAPTLASVNSKNVNLKNYKNQQNLLLLHEQRFHPELTNKYDFKEGKHLLINTVNEQSCESKSEDEDYSRKPLPQPICDETIGPKSFVPIMILGKGSFGEVYLVQK